MSGGLPDINGPRNVSGEVKFVDDPTTQPTGENVIIKYNYKIQYINIAVGSNVSFDKKPEEVQQKQIENLLNLGIDIVNKRREVTTNVKRVQRENNITNNKVNESKKIYMFLSDEEIEKYLNPLSENTNQSGVGMVVIVGNNAGLPIYTFSNTLFTVGNEEQSLNLAKQTFELDPPYMTIPASDIYTTNPETGEIQVDQDWYEQQYPPEGSEVEFIGELEPIPYTFSSIVVDLVTNDLLKYAKIEDLNGSFTTADFNGNFTLEGEYIPGEIQQITVSHPDNYNINTVSITTQAGSLRNDINFIPLTPTIINTDSSILKTKSTPDSTKNRLNQEDFKNFIGTIIKKAMDEIQNRLYPFIINKLLTEPFGIGDPIQLIKQAKQQAEYLKKNRKKKLKKTNLNIKEFEDDQGQISNAIYEDQSDLARFLISLKPGESFIDGNGNMYTADSRGRISPGSMDTLDSADDTFISDKEMAFGDDNQANFDDFDNSTVNDFTFTPDDGAAFEQEFGDLVVTSSFFPTTKPLVKTKKVKYKVKYPKPKGTILRGGKFKKGGNKRTKNKKINFSGRRRW
tara:strand:+ start:1363 stop:3069 length:1707 start_codon:yes stop_codon:yes gene_type:complete